MHDVFQLPPMSFPPTFVWGSATSAYQVEGHPPDAQGRYDPAGKAANHWELYRQDVDLIAQLGHQAYRFSINWARVEPEENHFDPQAIDHYRDLLDRLSSKGIQPWVCLHHFVQPEWFTQKGGFGKRANLGCWERFLEKVVPLVAPQTTGWLPFNEFNSHLPKDQGQAKMNCLRAHGLAYHLIRQYSDKPISHAHAFEVWEPRRPYDELDRRVAAMMDFMVNEFFFHAIRTGELVYPGQDGDFDANVKDSVDWWGVNYYVRHLADARQASMLGPRLTHNRLKLIDLDNFFLEEFYPDGLLAACERLRDKPIIVTENGLACDDDRWRIVYLAQHLAALHEAVTRGIDVRGYMYWSLMDNFEWGSFVPRFGLVHVDFDTFARTPRPSADFYRKIIAANALTPDLLREFLTELPTGKPRQP